MYEIKSRAGTEGSPVSSLKCDRPSHPDWGRLSVVRIIDGRGQQAYIGRLHVGTCQRNLPAKLGSINIQCKPQG